MFEWTKCALLLFSFLILQWISLPSPVLATDPNLGEVTLSDAEARFLLGYQAYLSKNYGLCADDFFQALELEEPLNHKARFYLAVCQYKLGLKQNAAFHISKINSRFLSASDRRILTILKNSLVRETRKLNPGQIFLYPYLGGIFYSPGAGKSAGMFFGLYSDITNNYWKFSLGIEQLSLSLLNVKTTYTQTQGLLGLARTFESSFETRGKAIYISNPLSTSGGILVLSVGSAYSPWSYSRLSLDLFYSHYPASSLGVIRAFQVSNFVEQGLLSKANLSASIRFGFQSIFSSSDLTTDSTASITSGFTRRSYYQRISMDLMTTFSNWILSGGVWGGTEAFGIRNEGAIVYSALEEHRSGWNIYSHYSSFNLGFRLTFSQEGLSIRNSDVTINTICGTIYWML